ncbi:MAG: phosphotransferase [Dehalococcoidia bacterium]
MPNPPPPAVLEASRAAAGPVPLAGGQGTSFRAGSIVLKPAEFPYDEAAALLFERLEVSGFRVPRPVRSADARLVVDGWTASEFIDGEHAGPNGGRWPETIAACKAFHAALENVPLAPWNNLLAARSDAWAEADRLTFDERSVEPLPPFREAIMRLTRFLRPVDSPSQLIHGDFTANVLFAEGKPPGVIDFSPYWRPGPFALGVVVADAIAWADADESILEHCADVPEFPQWLARGALRRVWELDQHSRRGRGYTPVEISAYEPAITRAARNRPPTTHSHAMVDPASILRVNLRHLEQMYATTRTEVGTTPGSRSRCARPGRPECLQAGPLRRGCPRRPVLLGQRRYGRPRD